MSATETTDQSAAEMRGLLRFAQGLGLDEAIVQEIYEIVGEKPRRLARGCIVFGRLKL